MYFQIFNNTSHLYNQQCCGAATFSVEPEPIFYLAGAAFFKAAPAASFWQEKKESLVLVTNMT